MLKLGALCAAAVAWGMVGMLAAWGRPAGIDAPDSAVPVVVELFTSEGCSDCPPADAVLAKLASQSMSGVQVIALGEHVDYWDRQGWRDPFSSPAFTRRQLDYASALHVESPYTPQMIVNGHDEFVGSNSAIAQTAIARASHDGARQLQVTVAADAAVRNVIPLRISVATPPDARKRGTADVFVAVTEDHLTSRVQAGENRGKTLQHSAVVRSLARVGGFDASATTWSGGGEAALEPQWQRTALHIVAFVQDRSSKAILGAATAATN